MMMRTFQFQCGQCGADVRGEVETETGSLSESVSCPACPAQYEIAGSAGDPAIRVTPAQRGPGRAMFGVPFMFGPAPPPHLVVADEVTEVVIAGCYRLALRPDEAGQVHLRIGPADRGHWHAVPAGAARDLASIFHRIADRADDRRERAARAVIPPPPPPDGPTH